MFRSVLQTCRFLSVSVKSPYPPDWVAGRITWADSLSWWDTGVSEKVHRDSKKASLASYGRFPAVPFRETEPQTPIKF
jgi:hypothetical protein